MSMTSERLVLLIFLIYSDENCYIDEKEHSSFFLAVDVCNSSGYGCVRHSKGSCANASEGTVSSRPPTRFVDK